MFFWFTWPCQTNTNKCVRSDVGERIIISGTGIANELLWENTLQAFGLLWTIWIFRQQFYWLLPTSAYNHHCCLQFIPEQTSTLLLVFLCNENKLYTPKVSWLCHTYKVTYQLNTQMLQKISNQICTFLRQYGHRKYRRHQFDAHHRFHAGIKENAYSSRFKMALYWSRLINWSQYHHLPFEMHS